MLTPGDDDRRPAELQRAENLLTDSETSLVVSSCGGNGSGDEDDENRRSALKTKAAATVTAEKPDFVASFKKRKPLEEEDVVAGACRPGDAFRELIVSATTNWLKLGQLYGWPMHFTSGQTVRQLQQRWQSAKLSLAIAGWQLPLRPSFEAMSHGRML